MPTQRPSISAFFPAYNDGGTIGSLVVTTLNTLAELTDDYEVVVVENGSTDYTVEVLEELAKQYDHFRFLAHREALGYGGALRVGFETCRKDLIFYTDGDAQYDPREIKQLLPAMIDGVDVVNGWKIERHDPIHRIVIGRLYHHFVKLMFGFKLRDVDCDFRLLRREVLDLIDLEFARRHNLSGAGQEAPRCRLQLRRGAGSPLPPHLRQEPVLQFPAPQPRPAACGLAMVEASCTARTLEEGKR